MQGVQGVQAVDLGLPGDLLFSPGDSPFLPGDLPFCELGDLPFCGPGDLPFCGPGDLPFCMPGDWPLCVVIRVEVEGLGSSSSSSSDLFPSVSNCSEMGGSFCVSYNLGLRTAFRPKSSITSSSQSFGRFFAAPLIVLRGDLVSWSPGSSDVGFFLSFSLWLFSSSPPSLCFIRQ